MQPAFDRMYQLGPLGVGGIQPHVSMWWQFAEEPTSKNPYGVRLGQLFVRTNNMFHPIQHHEDSFGVGSELGLGIQSISIDEGNYPYAAGLSTGLLTMDDLPKAAKRRELPVGIVVGIKLTHCMPRVAACGFKVGDHAVLIIYSSDLLLCKK